MGAADGEVLGPVQGAGRRQDRNRSTAAEATGARELGTDPKSGKPVSVRLGRYGPYAQIGTARTTKTSRRSPRCVPARACTRSRWRTRWSCSSCRASSGQSDGRGSQRRHRPLRPVRQARQRVRLAEEGRRSVHDRPGARGVPDRGEGRDRAQPHHQGLRRQRRSRCSTAATARTSATASSTARIPKDREPASLTLEEVQQADGGNRQADAQGLRQEGRREEGRRRRRQPRRRRPRRRR